MNPCDQFTRMQEKLAQAQLDDDALRDWQAHAQGCAVCSAQQHAAQELRQVLGGQAAPRVSPGFALVVLRRAREAQAPAAGRHARLSRRGRLLLALNWVAVALVCVALAAMIQPEGNFQRSPAFLLPLLFTLATAVLAVFLRQSSVKPSR